MYGCFYATIMRRNMACLATAGKCINSTQSIARQLLGKQVPAPTDMHPAMEERRYATSFYARVKVLLDCNNENGVVCCCPW
jgi:hypothetical protein